MKKTIISSLAVLLVMGLALVMMTGCSKEEEKIKIGFNIPLTGDIPKVGEASKNAAEMLLADINAQGGLEVGGKKFLLNFSMKTTNPKQSLL